MFLGSFYVGKSGPDWGGCCMSDCCLVSRGIAWKLFWWNYIFRRLLRRQGGIKSRVTVVCDSSGILRCKLLQEKPEQGQIFYIRYMMEAGKLLNQWLSSERSCHEHTQDAFLFRVPLLFFCPPVPRELFLQQNSDFFFFWFDTIGTLAVPLLSPASEALGDFYLLYTSYNFIVFTYTRQASACFFDFLSTCWPLQRWGLR